MDIRFQFGSWVVRVCTDHPALFKLIQERYAPFVVHGSFDIDVTCHVRHQFSFDGPALLKARHVRPTLKDSIHGWSMRGAFFDATLRPGSIQIHGPLATYPIDFVLAQAWVDAHKQAALIHGAAIVDGERGWLCSGPSGAGKSTLARLMGFRALCDEFAGVVREHSDIRLVGLPFWQGRPGTARLDAIMMLRHGPRHQIAPCHPREALRLLSRQMVWGLRPDDVQRGLAMVQDLLARVPCYVLAFTPDIGVWDVIREVA